MSSEFITSTDAVQVIDEDKQFQQLSINDYVKNVIKVDLGLHYHVISVFGSQSTGKSTLLNRLFHTNFDVMNESKRQQTTKGIWLGYTSSINSTIQNSDEKLLVMDVEGSDGRERGEDQDFERKAALFALATSEVLIVNIWEHQVGLYQGANMGLLKTVFEVNLSLFGNQSHKVLLLFVIRDHVGNTPLDNLSNTLTQDLNKMWEAIAKPKTVDADVKLSDYFDLQFTALAHKVLQPEQFDLNIKQLGDKFTDSTHPEYIFKQEYRQNFPIDGWTLYANNCWDQIQSNKDLDLPTQQILVARFRCDEIAKESFALFSEEYVKIFDGVKLDTLTGAQLSAIFIQLNKLALHTYDSQASHYNKAVYKARRDTLDDDVSTKLNSVYQDFVKELTKSSLLKFKQSFNDKSNKSSFLEKSKTAKEQSLSFFKENIEPLQDVNQKEFASEPKLGAFTLELDEALDNLRRSEIEHLITRTIKKITPLIKNQTFEIFGTPDETLWDKVLDNFKSVLNTSLSRYEVDDDVYDFKLGSTNEENAETVTKIRKAAWISFDGFIHEYLRDENVVNILRREFEDTFSYDLNNIPRVWKNELEIADAYKKATDYALKSLPIFSLAKLSNGTEIIPDYQEDVEDEGDEEEPHRFAHILTAPQQLKIKQQFLKIAEISYRDANRSIVTNIAKIPPFIYILLLVLGWNEFMAILRNPLYLVLTIFVGTGLFFVHTLNLWGPLNTASAVFVQQGKGWLAGVLLDQPERAQPIRAGSPNGKEYTENIELDDLSLKED